MAEVAERVGFEPTCRFYPTIRFRVGAVVTASVPLRPVPGLRGAAILAERHGAEGSFVRAWMRTAGLTLLAVLGACSKPAADALQEIRARGELRVVTLNLPTCYYLGSQGTEGLEFELASAYAARLGVRLNMYPLANEHALQAELAAGRADIAAASLTNTPEWSRAGDAAEPYAHIPQLVVYAKNAVRPRETLQLESAKVAVRAGSPQERILQRLKSTVAPQLQWEETAPSSADPVEDVDSGDALYAITDAREFSFAHHLYPNLLVGFALPEERPVQWIVRHDAPALLASVNAFLRDLSASGTLAELMDETSGDTRRFAYEESREFQTHVGDRLPRYRSWFEQAARQSGLDWRLLAAVGYQESKWDPEAQSFDGARGVMMLTADTAQALGIRDRSNPEQSIFAGARYLAQVREKIPERIVEPDRTWLTVAAYNVGFGHLEDARIIAQQRGKDPDSWMDVRQQLPLLAQERWYTRARRGYARGWEPVQFVDRIQRYLTLLEWQPGESGTAQAVQSPTTPAVPGAAVPSPAPPPAAPPTPPGRAGADEAAGARAPASGLRAGASPRA
jgi:membrane-bound lytic murein transglycosylase F